VGPTVCPAVGPAEGPAVDPAEGPAEGPTVGPADGPAVGPAEGPTEGPAVGPAEGPAVGPAEGPAVQEALTSFLLGHLFRTCCDSWHLRFLPIILLGSIWSPRFGNIAHESPVFGASGPTKLF
jgi:hypothetical protein